MTPHPPGRPGTVARLVIAVVLAGVAAGLVGIAMALLLEGFETLFYGVGEGSLPERVEAAPSRPSCRLPSHLRQVVRERPLRRGQGGLPGA